MVWIGPTVTVRGGIGTGQVGKDEEDEDEDEGGEQQQRGQ